MSENYFPQGIAKGHAFLGREEETSRLSANLEQGRHTLLMAPRRYGKTSLARHVISQGKHIYKEIDLFLAIDAAAIGQIFLSGIEDLMHVTSDTTHNLLHSLINFFKRSEKKWTIGIKGVKVELKPENQHDTAANILLAFEALEYVLQKKKQKVIFFVDEFQEINRILDSRALEGAIRHFAQSCKFVVFIFSGSSRNLLADIFGNRNRPLYALCDWINLKRLDMSLYEVYLNKIAEKTWNKELKPDAIESIFHLTECHPETVYTLCAALWQHCRQYEKTPTKEIANTVWRRLIHDRLKQTRLNLSSCSTGQLKILILIASGVETGLTGKASQHKLNLTSPSIVNALASLETADLIEKQEDRHYRIIDPIIKSTLIENYLT